MRICFDLDETLCTGYPYNTAVPLKDRISIVNRLKASGHVIIIYTARGMGSSGGNTAKAIKNIGKLTLEQLDAWGVKYDEIVFGKPSADYYIDDKGINANNMLQFETLIGERSE